MDGALIIDKPAGMTSHDVVAAARRVIGERRVGHTGTLDPFATGVLVLLVGRATRLAQFLSGAEKEYEAVIRLGYATDTGDVTGNRLEGAHAKAQRTPSLRKENIETAMASLRGEIEQTPPMYSAKKIAGRRLYELARRGEEVERAPIRVNIKTFEMSSNDNSWLQENKNGTSDLRVRVVCSTGTYVRTLAEDFGRQLGIGAHLADLRRTRVGEFKIEDAIMPDRLAEIAESDSIEPLLISPSDALSHLPSIELADHDAQKTLHGIDLPVGTEQTRTWNDLQSVRMCHQDALIAVGTYEAGRNFVHPVTVIAK